MGRAVITLEDVTFSYPLGSDPALVNVCCSFEEGKLYGVIGPNGAGKTTLALLISGFATTTEKGRLTGSCHVAGRSIEDWGEGELASTVGYVLQNPFNQISGSKETVFEEIGFGLENLGVPSELMEEHIVAIAREANITDLLLKNPFELSGGQQQRVALASVLVMEPQILVIDEPASQLDPAGADDIFAIIAKLKQAGKTVILVEHKLDQLAECADEILALKDGHIAAAGPASEVFSDLSLLDRGIPFPRVSLLFGKLAAQGVRVPKVPSTYAEARGLLAEMMGVRVK